LDVGEQYRDFAGEPLDENGLEAVEELKEEPEMTIKDFNVTVSEYSTVEDFVNDIANNLEEGSEYRKTYGLADFTLANAAVHYVNYFEHEIDDMGLNEDFEEWQLIAYDVVLNENKEDGETYKEKFKNKTEEILSKL